LNRARRSVDRTDSDRAGLPVGLKLSGTAVRNSVRKCCSIGTANESNKSISSVERLSGMGGGSGAGARC
jgi:hypothetical protein